ncbi:MAG: multidrug DMT transporter permease [Bacteroidetes bacterium RBG_13_43_22]|nr:MAG: multidrug DMT transporter permease [Bacteroidetes bacterium RBG_13_43_22]OFY78548.1 MAG: multidrug DMT transporter permease [Bacteroidetes bacterium RBG_19FT_COMBO_42_7]
MILVHNYGLAIFFFAITMICWGSWANTQKLAARTWRFELFYWDLTLGLLLTAAIAAFTLGNLGTEGRPFLTDIAQANSSSIINAMLGGIVWNLGNILLVAAIAVAGMSVGFPIGGGIAWILGIIFNFILVIIDKGSPEGNVVLLFAGVVVIIAAIFLSMLSYKKLTKEQKKPSAKGIILSVAAGVLIAFFYGLVVKSLDNTFVTGGAGTLTPYTGVFFFAVGVAVSTPIFNPIFMRYPVDGNRVRMKEYFKGSFLNHSSGLIGGFIWMTGMVVSFMSAGSANPAISYALSNAAPVVAILWGIFIWKEFKDAPKSTNTLLITMFICFLIGLVLITMSNT